MLPGNIWNVLFPEREICRYFHVFPSLLRFEVIYKGQATVYSKKVAKDDIKTSNNDFDQYVSKNKIVPIEAAFFLN